MTKKALIVGINLYAPPAGPDLEGCVNDAQNVAYTLNALHIVPARPATMHIVTDQKATKATILTQLGWLLKGAKKGDVLIYYHSSHGTQIADVEGDEIDHKDEALCPHDCATAGFITDDILRGMFSKLPAGVNLDVILDTCHSGSGTREFSTVNPGWKYRYMEPPLDYGFFLDADPNIPTKGILKPRAGQKAVAIASINHVLWAACRDNQTSAEASIEGKPQGAFTYCFCKGLRAYGTDLTRRKLDGLVGQCIKKLGTPQIPQLEGTTLSMDEKVFC
ncbi:MAG: caspase family protein [Methanomicrobiales archaeon]|nr:caspase family protein [Methanomicrobiales archaeon]